MDKSRSSFRCPRGGSIRVVVICALSVVFAGSGGAWLLFSGNGDDTGEEPILETVIRGPYKSVVLDQGEVESSNNIEIRCEVQSRNSSGTTILEVVPEGQIVRGALVAWPLDPIYTSPFSPIFYHLQKSLALGDLLVRLDSSSFEQERDQQLITVNTSHALVAQAESALEAAKEAKVEYFGDEQESPRREVSVGLSDPSDSSEQFRAETDEGVYHQDLRVIENEITEAKENARKAEQYLKYSERLASKSYVTALQLEADKFAVDKARNALGLAELKKKVLQGPTRRKQEIQFDSDIRAADIKLKNERKSHEVELKKLSEISDQIAKCTIRVPFGIEGQVVHANKYSSRGNAEFVVEEGVPVREKQVIIRLPDPKQMQVKAKVNESRITRVKTKMSVQIQLDALNEQKLNGEVTRVNQYAEPGGFSSGGIKKYAVYVKIIDPPPEIRPGMNASVSILVEQRPDALQIPLQAVYEIKGHTFCIVKDGDKWETREIKIGSNNEQMAVVDDGVGEGDQVVMNPRRHKDKLKLPELSEDSAENQGRPKGGGKGKSKGAGRRGGGGPPRMSSADMFKGLDKDSNDELSAEELSALPDSLPGPMREAIAAADTDGDGTVSKDEFILVIAAVKKQMSNGGAGRPEGGQ